MITNLKINTAKASSTNTKSATSFACILLSNCLRKIRRLVFDICLSNFPSPASRRLFGLFSTMQHSFLYTGCAAWSPPLFHHRKSTVPIALPV
jgi:hypothetical protein